MVYPVRSEDCEHAGCFDALTFFEQFKSCLTSPEPRCPVCNKMITFDSIRVDNYFKNALDG